MFPDLEAQLFRQIREVGEFGRDNVAFDTWAVGDIDRWRGCRGCSLIWGVLFGNSNRSHSLGQLFAGRHDHSSWGVKWFVSMLLKLKGCELV